VTVGAYRLREAAELLGVSDDTVRRWAASGRLEISTDASGRQVVDGVRLAALAQELAESSTVADPDGTSHTSARNRLVGLVTNVVRDTVMAQVELQCGPFRVVSLMSREAADDLGLEPGVRAIASIKSTTVVIEKPKESS
jgi:molybdopterin-binding protein